MSNDRKASLTLVSDVLEPMDDLIQDDYRIKFPELRKLLMRWRKEKFPSSWIFQSKVSFSVPYQNYWNYENGVVLPSTIELEEIALALGKEPRDAMICWAQTQMHSPELKALFTPKYFGIEPEPAPGLLERLTTPKSEIRSNQIPASERHDAWLLDDVDRKSLERDPWLLRILAMLQAAWPLPVTYQEFELNKREEFDVLKKSYLQHWIATGRIKETIGDLVLSQKHFAIPATEAWETVRRQYAEHIFQSQNKKITSYAQREGTAIRSTMIKRVSLTHARSAVEQAKNFEMDLKTIPTQGDDDRTAVTVEMAFTIGPVESIIPVAVLRAFKKAA